MEQHAAHVVVDFSRVAFRPVAQWMLPIMISPLYSKDPTSASSKKNSRRLQSEQSLK
jgi:hypothetical protein